MNKEIYRITVSGLYGPDDPFYWTRSYKFSIYEEISVYYVLCTALGRYKKCDEYETLNEAMNGLRHHMKLALNGMMFITNCSICNKPIADDRGEKCKECSKQFVHSIQSTETMGP